MKLDLRSFFRFFILPSVSRINPPDIISLSSIQTSFNIRPSSRASASPHCTSRVPCTPLASPDPEQLMGTEEQLAASATSKDSISNLARYAGSTETISRYAFLGNFSIRIFFITYFELTEDLLRLQY